MKWVDQSPAPDWPLWSERSGALPRVRVARGVHRQVLGRLRQHSVEDGGLLLGVPYRHVEGPGQIAVVEVLQAVPAPSGDGTAVSLRMDGEVWTAANLALDALRIDVPLARVVGWYHSHPGFGAFFSDTDRRTQAAFFREAYGVGWCVDPSDDSHAFFLGPASDPVVAELIGDG